MYLLFFSDILTLLSHNVDGFVLGERGYRKSLVSQSLTWRCRILEWMIFFLSFAERDVTLTASSSSHWYPLLRILYTFSNTLYIFLFLHLLPAPLYIQICYIWCP